MCLNELMLIKLMTHMNVLFVIGCHWLSLAVFGKEQAKEYYENKENCKNKLEINIKNYVMKKRYKQRICKKKI